MAAGAREGCLLAGALLLLAPAAFAQQASSEAVAEHGAGSLPSGAGNPGPVAVDTLGPNDLVELTVPYCPELSHSFRISADGTLPLPLLHGPLPVAGLSAAEAASHIRAALSEQGVLNEPVVNLAVLEARSRPVSVLGAVNHPLTFQVNGPLTLAGAIAQAGGLAPTAGPEVIVTRERVDPATGQVRREVTTVPTAKLMGSADPAINLRLQGSEEVRVPEAGKIFVTGDVRRPGMFPMQNDASTTVMKALALSEGLAPYPASFAYIYRRRTGSDDRTEIKVPLARIIARKDADVALQADDVLYVPENGGKKMTSRVLAQIVGFGQQAGTGVLIYH